MAPQVRKLLIPVQGSFVAPRFDLAAEVRLIDFRGTSVVTEPRTIILGGSGEENLFRLIVEEKVTDLICGGIEQRQYDFLVWKNIVVLDGVIGNWRTALRKTLTGTLQRGEILKSHGEEHPNQ